MSLEYETHVFMARRCLRANGGGRHEVAAKSCAILGFTLHISSAYKYIYLYVFIALYSVDVYVCREDMLR